MRTVLCSYCGKPAELVDSAEVYGGRSCGMVWLCRPCKAWVGVHRNSKTFAPLGRLANAELRDWKKRAHNAFDALWRSGKVTREQAYSWLRAAMGLTVEQAHIGRFDVPECKKLVELLSGKAVTA